MPIFKAKTQDNIATVSQKLADAQAALAELEEQLRDRALAVALDEPGAEEAVGFLHGRIAGGRQTVELLEAALQAAEAAERQRLARARADADVARIRSIKTHVAALSKGAHSLQAAALNLVTAYREIASQQAAILKLAKAEERELMGLCRRALLDTYVSLELSRVGAAQPNSGSISFPGTHWDRTHHGGHVGHGQRVTDVAPLADQLRGRFDGVLAVITGAAPAAPVAPRIAEPIADPEPEPIDEPDRAPPVTVASRKRTGKPTIFTDDRVGA